MSELKAYEGDCILDEEVYLKSEADKVIADLQAKVTLASLADDCSNLCNKRCNYCSALLNERKLIAEKDKKIAELEEAQRWRKYSEEKPSSDGYYIICGSSGFRNSDRFMECKDGRGMDFSFYSCGVKYWMPMPELPNELKET